MNCSAVPPLEKPIGFPWFYSWKHFGSTWYGWAISDEKKSADDLICFVRWLSNASTTEIYPVSARSLAPFVVPLSFFTLFFFPRGGRHHFVSDFDGHYFEVVAVVFKSVSPCSPFPKLNGHTETKETALRTVTKLPRISSMVRILSRNFP